MPATAKRREYPGSKAHEPGVVEANMLTFLGFSPKDVAACAMIELRRAKRLDLAIDRYGEGPYTIEQVAKMLGLSYRYVYREFPGNGSVDEEGRRVVGRTAVEALCKAHLSKDANQKARFLTFMGVDRDTVAKRAFITKTEANAILRELEEKGCGPESEGPYNTAQCSAIVGLSVRAINHCVNTGRLETVGDRMWQSIISREALERFARTPRISGYPSKEYQRALAKNGHA